MLHLLPNLIDEESDPKQVLPSYLWEVMASLQGVIVETPKAARRFFKHFCYKELLALPIKSYNEHTKEDEFEDMMEPMGRGEVWGYLSDAGLPCIADPGYRLVRLAQKRRIQVHGHVGPSSVVLSLMLSGLNASSFTFYGYFPRELSDIHKWMSSHVKVHVFIETPYRGQQTLEKLLSLLKPQSLLSIAIDLTGARQEVHTHTIQEWKKKKIDLEKRPAVYLISI
jgi:16S rRNA (cytidine1402-2'-O)-methyltransferase